MEIFGQNSESKNNYLVVLPNSMENLLARISMMSDVRGFNSWSVL